MSAAAPPLELAHILASFALVLLIAGVSYLMKLGLHTTIVSASVRGMVQVLGLGYALSWLFNYNSPAILLVIAAVMCCFAAWTSYRRLKCQLPGALFAALLATSLPLMIIMPFAFHYCLPVVPWYHLTHSVPIVGMVLGSSLTGMTLAANTMLQEVSSKRCEIEGYLSLGATRLEALQGSIRESFRAGMMPILNAMTVVGIVSIPGMMTGQMLTGHSPLGAAAYQMVILLLICCNSFFSIFTLVYWYAFALVNRQHQWHEHNLRRIWW